MSHSSSSSYALSLPPQLLADSCPRHFSRSDINLPGWVMAHWAVLDDPQQRTEGLSGKPGPFATFKYTLAGEGAVTWAGKHYPQTPGNAVLMIIPGDYSEYLPAHSPRWEAFTCMFDGNDLLRHAEWIIAAQGPFFTLAPAHPAVQAAAAFCRATVAGLPTAESAAALLYPLLMSLHEAVASQQPDFPAQLTRAQEFIVWHYAEDIGIADLLTVTRTSHVHLWRLFQRFHHMSPLRYLTRVRLAHAMALLRNSLLPLTEIAPLCGFQDSAYFCRVFHRELGVTPMSYRRGEETDATQAWNRIVPEGRHDVSPG